MARRAAASIRHFGCLCLSETRRTAKTPFIPAHSALKTHVNALMAGIQGRGLSRRSSRLRLCAGRRGHGRMNRVAMAHEIGVGGDELLERRIDVVKMDIGDEAIDAGVDARRF